MPTNQPPTFEQARNSSKNGKERLGASIQGRYFTYRVRTAYNRSTIDFDLFLGNHDLRDELQDELMHRYRAYCTAFNHCPKIHSHFGKTSLMCEVKPDHAEEWFSLLWETLSNVENLSRIRCEFLSDYANRNYGRITAGGLLLPDGRVDDGDVIKVIVPAFQEIVKLLQFDYKVLHNISPRDFEELLAAAYDRLGFDDVVLTPRSGDHGRDVIAEKKGLGKIKLFVEAKRYSTDNLVKAQEVRALLGTMLAEPESTKAVFITTSDFAPRLKKSPSIAPHIGNRLELLNGEQLVERLVQIEHSSEKPTLGF